MIRIALVEDQKAARDAVLELIKSDADCVCVSACGTAARALKEIPRQKPDLVLMNIRLPDLSGSDCTARLKQLLPGVPVIMITADEDTERILKALRAGASGCLLKRSLTRELLPAIREVLQGGAPMSREIARKVVFSFQESAITTAEVEALSLREREILELVAAGMSNKLIAARLGVTNGTVRWHLRHVYHKLHVRSRPQAARKFLAAMEDQP